MNCIYPSGKYKCFECKHYHSYYGCLSSIRNGKGFSQTATKKDRNFVQNDNK